MRLSIAGALMLFATTGVAFALPLSTTDFEGFTTGISVDGQGGWASAPKWDEEVTSDSGNTVWRVSNAVFAGSFGDMPFAPRPGGLSMTATDPVGGSPEFFAGEASTGANNRAFYGKFDFKSSTGTPQPGLRVTVSADNGQGGRQSFFAIEDNGSTGLNVTTFDVLPDGNFDGPYTIAENLSYTDWHSVGVDLKFIDGPSNDVVRYFVDNSLVHTDTSWEEFYTNFQPALHPLGVPVQTLLFRISSAATSDVTGNGFYIDNVDTGIGLINPQTKDECKNGGWEDFGFKNQGLCIQYVNTGKDSRE